MIIKTLRNEDEKKLKQYLGHVKKAVRTAHHPKKQHKKPHNYKPVDDIKVHDPGDLLAALFRKYNEKKIPEMLK